MIHSKIYIKHFGFSEIVRISSEWREERSGYQNEHTTEVIACKIEGQFFKTTVYYYSKTMGGNDYEILEQEPISNEEYQDYYERYGGILDTKESRDAIASYDSLQRKMSNIYPICPKCSGLMTKRKGTRGYFLGCLNFPNCKGTRNCNSSYESKYKKLQSQLNEISKKINA